MIPKLILDQAKAHWGDKLPLPDGVDLRLPAKEAWQGTEHDLQKKFFAYLGGRVLDRPEFWLIHAIPNGGKRSKAEASKFKAEGVKGGVPDVFIPITGNSICHGMYIEFKKAGGSPKEDQRFFLNTLIDAGYHCIVVNDLETAIREFEDYVG